MMIWFPFQIKGFEARGTDIAKKLTAWQNLVEETRPSGKLTSNPFGNVPRPLQEFVSKQYEIIFVEFVFLR